MSDLDHVKEFERAWADPANTRYALPTIDVNAVLAERYETSEPLTFTRTMLWDCEVRKAWRPDLFIPYVVAAGSADAWGEGDTFVRRSMQRRWLAGEEYGLVLEQTHLDHAAQKVTFIGAAEVTDRDGTPLHSDPGQRLFHVEHSVGGTEIRPLNEWRVVHLTDGPDDRLIKVFDLIAGNPFLPEFIEIYIRDVLGLGLTRKEA